MDQVPAEIISYVTSILVKRLRESGHVRRCHTIPHLGEYTVGKHSYDALSLLLVLHPGPSVNLIKAVLWHDAGERYCGDLPAPAKWASATLREAYETLEAGVVRRMHGLGEIMDSFTEDDKRWLDAVDRIEFMLWCFEQTQLGNLNVSQAYVAARDSLDQLGDKVPAPCREFLRCYTPDRLPERME